MKSHKTSQIWQYFSDIDRSHAQCNACKTRLSYRTSISNLRKHLVRKHFMNIEEAKEQFGANEDVNGLLFTKRKGSIIWQYFIKVNKKFAICKTCKVQLSYKTSTSNLAKHLTRKHPNIKFAVEITSMKTLCESDSNEFEISKDELKYSESIKTERDVSTTPSEESDRSPPNQAESQFTPSPSEADDTRSLNEDQQLEVMSNSPMVSALHIEIEKFRRRKKSDLWNYFTVIDHEFALCNICRVKLSYRTSVTNLKKHYDRKHQSRDYKEQSNSTLPLNSPEVTSATFTKATPSSRVHINKAELKQNEFREKAEDYKSSLVQSGEPSPPVLIPQLLTSTQSLSRKHNISADNSEESALQTPKLREIKRLAEEEEEIFGKFVSSELRRIKNKKYYLEVKKKIQIALMDAIEKDFEDYSAKE